MRATERSAQHEIEARLEIRDDEPSQSIEWLTVGENAQRQLELAARFSHRAVSVLDPLMRRLHLAFQLVFANEGPRDEFGFGSRIPQTGSGELAGRALE